MRQIKNENIILYHITSSQNFLNIIIEGQITPFEINNNISNGSYIKTPSLNAREFNPSLNTKAIYLQNTSCDNQNYGKAAVLKGEPSLFNFPVVLKIKVNTANLGPDLDDCFVNELDTTPFYQQTLDQLGQCVHIGNIHIRDITSVKPNLLGVYYHYNKFKYKDEFIN